MPLEKGCTTKSLWKRAPKPPKQNKSLWKRAAPQKAFGKGHKSKTRAFGKGPQAFEKGFKTFGKEFQPSFTSRTFGKGFKTFGKEFEFSFTSKVYRNQQAHKWPAGKNNQLMKTSENEI